MKFFKGKLKASFFYLLAFVAIAFLAGLLIIPSMYVAQAQGVAIFAEDGSLISGSSLVFTVLPSLFDNMGSIGLFVAFIVLLSMLLTPLIFKKRV